MNRTGQFTRELERRVMYVENKSTGEARIRWVRFSRTGRSVYLTEPDEEGERILHRERTVSGNFLESATKQEFWISAPKKRGGDAHPCDPPVKIMVDLDAQEVYDRIRGRKVAPKEPDAFDLLVAKAALQDMSLTRKRNGYAIKRRSNNKLGRLRAAAMSPMPGLIKTLEEVERWLDAWAASDAV